MLEIIFQSFVIYFVMPLFKDDLTVGPPFYKTSLTRLCQPKQGQILKVWIQEYCVLEAYQQVNHEAL